jgi:cell shape-determining protein MreC
MTESARGVALAVTSPTALARDSAEMDVLAQEARGASRVLHDRTQLPATDRLPPTDADLLAQHLSGAVVARVIGGDPAGRRGLLLLNRGATAGVGRGMAVVAGPDVVAQTDRVNRSTTVAYLVTDRQFSAPVRIIRTSAYVGSVQGDGKMGLVLRALPSATDVREGDVLVTAASETGPAADLRVGVVERVVRDGSPAERGAPVHYRVSVRPRAPLRHLDVVRVVRGTP